MEGSGAEGVEVDVQEVELHKILEKLGHAQKKLILKSHPFYFIVYLQRSYKKLKKAYNRMKRVNQKLHENLLIVEEKFQMHESDQVIDDQNDESPYSPLTQFVIGSFANQGCTKELVPSTITIDEF